MRTEYCFSPSQEARLKYIDETIDMLLHEKARIYEKAPVRHILNDKEYKRFMDSMKGKGNHQ